MGKDKPPFTPTIEGFKFSDIFENFMAQAGMARLFLTVVSSGIIHGGDQYRKSLSGTFEEMRPGGPLAHLLVDAKEFFKSGEAKILLDKAVAGAMETSQQATASAALVYAHSALEALVDAFLSLASEVDQTVFERIIAKKQVKVGEVVDKGIDRILSECTRDYVCKQKKESLRKKTSLLSTICAPAQADFNTGKYKYSQNTIDGIDRKRHAVIHQLDFSITIKEIETDMDYFYWLGLYFMILMSKKFGLKHIPGRDARERVAKAYGIDY
ncbi:MAG: hypothetical protein KOO62_04980 [candidate division Zixibacteria bacterium]|nr:hypothetical protein [candidate division Zixibacteria bacterium]